MNTQPIQMLLSHAGVEAEERAVERKIEEALAEQVCTPKENEKKIDERALWHSKKPSGTQKRPFKS